MGALQTVAWFDERRGFRIASGMTKVERFADRVAAYAGVAMSGAVGAA